MYSVLYNTSNFMQMTANSPYLATINISHFLVTPTESPKTELNLAAYFESTIYF